MTPAEAQEQLQGLIHELVERDEVGFYVPDSTLAKGSVTAFFAGARLSNIAKDLGVPCSVHRDESIPGIRLYGPDLPSAGIINLDPTTNARDS